MDRVAELCLQALRERTKDLRVACYLTEAALWLDGFPGLTDCLRLTTELIRRFWDSGLHPDIDGGDLDYRASALVWLDERMPDVLVQVNLTARTGAENYTFARYQQAKRVGTESAIASVSAEKRETIQGLIRQGWITMDAFDSAMRATKRGAFEEICLPFEEAYRQLLELERLTDERFGAAAPTFSNAKETFEEIRKLLLPILKSKQEDSPNQTSPTGASEVQSVPLAVPGEVQASWIAGPAMDGSSGWEEAEAQIRSGKIDQGLAQMAALAAQETSGRGRFMRKLVLSDVCVTTGRNRMARTLLEELNEQIQEYKLERWESSGLVGAVWSRLYKLYRKSEKSSDQDTASALYGQLCRLDPWQAYISCQD